MKEGASTLQLQTLQKIFYQISLSFVLTLLVMLPSLAATATATLNSNEAVAGESVELTISLNGARFGTHPQLPKIKGIEIESAGRSTQIQIINGKMSSAEIYSYALTPVQAGQYQIGPFRIRSGNQTLTTNVVNLSVTNNNSNNSNNSQTTNPDISERDTEKYLFLKIKPSRNTLYLGEKIPLTIKLYVRKGVGVDGYSNPTINQSAVTIEPLAEPSETEEIIDGALYQVLDFSTTLSPVQVGQVNLGPFIMKCNVMVRDSDSDSLIDQFLGSSQKELISLKSNTVSLKILPLPAGQPASFSGAVGRFQLNATVSPPEVLQGDPVTVKLTLSGSGNLQTAGAPILTGETDFKTYPIQRKKTTQQGDEQQFYFEQILIPLKSGQKNIPSYRFSYFDPELNKYQELNTPILPITVKANPNFRIDSVLENSNSNSEKLGNDLVYIKDQLGTLKLKNSHLYQQPWFWFMQLLPFFAMLAAFGYRHYQKILVADTPWSRAQRANTQAEKELVKLQTMLKNQEYQKIPEATQQVVRKYLGEKYKLTTAGMTSEVTKELTKLAVPAKKLQLVKDFFESYNLLSFTGIAIDQSAAEKLLNLATEIIIEKKSTVATPLAQETLPPGKEQIS